MASSRRRSWSDHRFAGDALVAGADVFANLLATAPAMDTQTVIRIVGDLWVQYLVSNGIVDSLSIVDIGIGVSSVESFAISGGAMPAPDDATEFPPRGWLYVASQPVSQQADAVGVISTRAHFKFDIRAMRKIDKGVLYVRLVNNNITVGGAMQITGRIRSLCLT